MPGMFNGKATEYTEYTFKMEACMSTLGPAGSCDRSQGHDAEVANLAAIYWNVSALNSVGIILDHHDHRRSWHACSSSVAGIPGSGLRAWQELNRWYRPKSALEGAASMAGIIAPSRAKSIAELQRFIMDWELRVAKHEARHNDCVQDSVKVAAG